MKKRYLVLAGILAATVIAAGCGKKEPAQQQAEVTATPVPVDEGKAGDLVDMKKPTDENAGIKNIIGTKTAAATGVVLINHMEDDISAIYIRPNTDDDDEWGEELVKGQFVLKDGEKALYYYDANRKDESGNPVTSFDIRISFEDEDRNECFFRKLPLTTMKQISLRMDGNGEYGIPYAEYLTLSGNQLHSTLNEVKERLGLMDEDEEEEEETEEELTPTPTPEVTVTPTPEGTVTPGPGDPGYIDPDEEPEEPEEPEVPDSGAEMAKQYIGQTLDALVGACGSPSNSEYEEEPEIGKTGYHHYDTFTVSTTIDENGNEIVAGVW